MPTVNGPDEITTLTGSADKVFYTDSSGDVQEVSIGTDGQTLVSTGATAPEFDGLTGLKGGNNTVLYTNPTGNLTELALSATAGDVLTSNGAAVAPSWVAAASGGSTSMTSSGSITAGDMVIENADGTVSTVTSTLQDFAIISGVTAQTTYANNYANAMAYDTANGCTALLQPDSNTSDNAYVVFITESGGTITTTAPFLICNRQNAGGQYLTICGMDYDDHNNVYLAIFKNSSTANTEAVAFTYDGSSVTIDAGTGAGYPTMTIIESTYLNNTDDYYNMCWDTTNNVFHVVMNTYDVTGRFIILNCSVTSGRVITASAPTIIASSAAITNAYFPNVVWDQTNGAAFCAFQKANSSENYYYYNVPFNGSTYTIGALTQVSFATLPYFIQCTYDHYTGQIVVAWGSGASGDTWMNVVDMSDNSIGTAINISMKYNVSAQATDWDWGGDSWLAPRNQSVFITNAAGAFVMRGGGTYSSYVITGTVAAGKTLVFNGSTPFWTQAANASGFYKASTNGWNVASSKLMIGYNPDATYKVAALTLAGGSTNVQRWIGAAEATVGTGVSVDITHIGGINESQTGLTAGSTYYIDSDGSLTATAPTLSSTNQWRKVGPAISATKILVSGSGDTTQNW